jgi:YD repeat-containing protein
MDRLGHSVTWAYDIADRVTGTTDRLGRSKAYTYLNNDLLQTEVWKDGTGTTVNTLTFGYNEDNRTRPADHVEQCPTINGIRPQIPEIRRLTACLAFSRSVHPAWAAPPGDSRPRRSSQRSGSQSSKRSAVGFSPNANNPGSASRRYTVPVRRRAGGAWR